MQNFDDFPTLEEVKKGIQLLIGYKWPVFNSTDDIDQHVKKITDKLFECFKVIPDMMYIHSHVKPLPISFFRARPLDTFNDKSLISEYKSTPINLCKNVQRCNFPYKPVFYSSNDAGTALMEIIRNEPFDVERKYLISKWVISNDLNTKVIPYLYSDLPEQNGFRLFGDKVLERIPEVFEQNLTDSQVKGLRLYFNYLASIFTENNYSLSASLVHRILYANHNYRADLFLYPSVQTDRKSINIAIHPNFVDTNMKLVRVYSVQVNKINKDAGEFNINIDKYGTIEGSIIMWKNIKPDDENYMKSVEEDFGSLGKSEFIPKNHAL